MNFVKRQGHIHYAPKTVVITDRAVVFNLENGHCLNYPLSEISIYFFDSEADLDHIVMIGIDFFWIFHLCGDRIRPNCYFAPPQLFHYLRQFGLCNINIQNIFEGIEKMIHATFTSIKIFP